MTDSLPTEVDAQPVETAHVPQAAFARSAAIFLFALVVGRAFEYGTRVVVARVFGMHDYGVWSLALALMTLAGVISLIGMAAVLPRYIGFYRALGDDDRIRGTLRTGLRIALSGTAVTVFVFLALGGWIARSAFGMPDLGPVLWVLGFALPLYVLGEIFYAALRGFRRTFYATLCREILLRGVPLATLPAFIAFGVKGVAISFLVGCGVYAIVGFSLLQWRVFNFVSGRAVPSERNLLAVGVPLIVAVMLVDVQIRLDTIMLGHFRTATEVALYNAAIPLAMGLALMVNIFHFAFVPASAELYATGKTTEIGVLFRWMTRYLILMAGSAALVLVLVPEEVLATFFGTDYVSAAPPLRILALAFFIHAVFALSGTLLVTANRNGYFLLASVVGISVNIVLNLLLIPKFGSTGAAWATLAGIVALNGVRTMLAWYWLRVRLWEWAYLRYAALVLGGMGVGYLALQPFDLSPAPSVVIMAGLGVSVVLMTMFMTGDINPRLLRQLTHGRWLSHLMG